MDEIRADYFEKMCDLITNAKRPKRVKGFKLPAVDDLATADSLKAISSFFKDIRCQFFHPDYPKNGTKIRDLERTVPENIIEPKE